MRLGGKYAAFVLGMVIAVMLVACSRNAQPQPQPRDYAAENAGLQALLPAKAGYNWIYNGFAEYGHQMELKAVTTENGSVIYRIAGEVEDPSGGEASGDFSLNLTYIIKEGAMWQKQTAPKMMDTFAEMELLRTPLTAQAAWEQKVRDKEGREYQLACTISEIKEDAGGKIYTVLYKDKNSEFYEKRQIQEKTGVIAFEKLWKSGQDSITMGYDLYREASGYQEQTTLKAYLPPLGQKLRYFGLAEYAHEGVLTKVSENEQNAVYRFDGTFQDGSGIPGEFKVEYHFDYQAGTVREKVVENTRAKKPEVNSQLRDALILKLPLEVGRTWEQEIDFEGQKKQMTAQIIGIDLKSGFYYASAPQKGPVMTVRYQVENAPGYYRNTYIEERRFEKGWGMVGFSNLMKGDLGLKAAATDYEVEQALVNNMFGYGIARE